MCTIVFDCVYNLIAQLWFIFWTVVTLTLQQTAAPSLSGLILKAGVKAELSEMILPLRAELLVTTQEEESPL